MKSFFLDTVGLIATWDEADKWHAAASAADCVAITNDRIPSAAKLSGRLDVGRQAADINFGDSA